MNKKSKNIKSKIVKGSMVAGLFAAIILSTSCSTFYQKDSTITKNAEVTKTKFYNLEAESTENKILKKIIPKVNTCKCSKMNVSNAGENVYSKNVKIDLNDGGFLYLNTINENTQKSNSKISEILTGKVATYSVLEDRVISKKITETTYIVYNDDTYFKHSFIKTYHRINEPLESQNLPEKIIERYKGKYSSKITYDFGVHETEYIVGKAKQNKVDKQIMNNLHEDELNF